MKSAFLLLGLSLCDAALLTPSAASRPISRRAAALCLPAIGVCALQLPANAAPASEEALLSELKDVRKALEPLPALLEQEKWDAVRSVLKTPPVGNLWNLGDSKNTLRKLADLRDDVELFELADDVAGALQLADQYTYDSTLRPLSLTCAASAAP